MVAISLFVVIWYDYVPNKTNNDRDCEDGFDDFFKDVFVHVFQSVFNHDF